MNSRKQASKIDDASQEFISCPSYCSSPTPVVADVKIRIVGTAPAEAIRIVDTAPAEAIRTVGIIADGTTR
jgi:hypothetical protein